MHLKMRYASFKLFIYYVIFLFEIIFLSILETRTNNEFNLPDFRWKETTCISSYGKWINLENNAVLYDVNISPYSQNISCWVKGNEIEFIQPIISNIIILEISLFLLCINLAMIEK